MRLKILNPRLRGCQWYYSTKLFNALILKPYDRHHVSTFKFIDTLSFSWKNCCSFYQLKPMNGRLFLINDLLILRKLVFIVILGTTDILESIPASYILRSFWRCKYQGCSNVLYVECCENYQYEDRVLLSIWLESGQ